MCEIDLSDRSLKNRYYYANSQPLAQDVMDSDPNYFDTYFYLHDRLGSVRMVIGPNLCPTDPNASVVNTYTYQPFGTDFAAETNATVYNPFKFTGQWYDTEIAQYYLRARQYDPAMMRFTSRDPVKGKRQQPLTLHQYLYCLNEPINRIDPSGRISDRIAGSLYGGYAMHAGALGVAAYGVATGNDAYLYAGLKMEGFIVGAMAVGAIVGPNPNALKSFVKAVAAVTVLSLKTPEGKVELVGVIMGDPHASQTIGGVAAWIGSEALDWAPNELWDDFWNGKQFEDEGLETPW